MRSIFQEPRPGKATQEGQAVSAVTGIKPPMATDDRGVSVKHVPNAGGKK